MGGVHGVLGRRVLAGRNRRTGEFENARRERQGLCSRGLQFRSAESVSIGSERTNGHDDERTQTRTTCYDGGFGIRRSRSRVQHSGRGGDTYVLQAGVLNLFPFLCDLLDG